MPQGDCTHLDRLAGSGIETVVPSNRAPDDRPEICRPRSRGASRAWHHRLQHRSAEHTSHRTGCHRWPAAQRLGGRRPCLHQVVPHRWQQRQKRAQIQKEDDNRPRPRSPRAPRIIAPRIIVVVPDASARPTSPAAATSVGPEGSSAAPNPNDARSSYQVAPNLYYYITTNEYSQTIGCLQ